MAGKVLWKFQFTKSSSQLCNAILWPTGTNLYILGLIDAHWILLQATLSQNPWFSLDEVTKINKKTPFSIWSIVNLRRVYYVLSFHLHENESTRPNKWVFARKLLALCSRNFKNVKLSLDFVEIWYFHRRSDFTWNQILAK